MLISQQARSGSPRHGSPWVSIAELRRQLSSPSTIADGHRQRLLELGARLARVQALGDEYARVDFSEHASAIGKVAAVA